MRYEWRRLCIGARLDLDAKSRRSSKLDGLLMQACTVRESAAYFVGDPGPTYSAYRPALVSLKLFGTVFVAVADLDQNSSGPTSPDLSNSIYRPTA